MKSDNDFSKVIMIYEILDGVDSCLLTAS